MMRIAILSLSIAVGVMQYQGVCAAEQIDPVDVAPDHYVVVLENDFVRVVRYQLEPGTQDTWHTHPSKVSVVTSGGLIRVTLEDGDSFDVTETSGTAAWMSPLGKHFVENIGDTTVQIILVEVKSAPIE